jgi:starch-binding outer membrane protein, SusD/RagB family
VDASGGSNDFPIYRYADVLLMQAECEVQLGAAAAAKPFIDKVRVRAGLNALGANPTLTDIYNERGFEWFGTFLLPKEYSPETQPATQELFPIPSSVLATNALLKQNPGYN